MKLFEGIENDPRFDFSDCTWEERLARIKCYATLGDVNFQYILANEYMASDKCNYAAAVELYKIVERKTGHPVTQAKLGEAYYYGRGVKVDYKEAARYFRLSAEQNCTDGLKGLGICRFHGRGVEQDYEIAGQLLFAASKWIDKEVYFYLGECNRIKGEKYLALHYYRKAAEESEPRAQCVLGDYHFNGMDVWVKQDRARAAEFYRQSAENGYPLGMYKFGCCYYYAHGVGKNLREAEKWLSRAQKNGFKDNKNLLPKVRAEIDQTYGNLSVAAQKNSFCKDYIERNNLNFNAPLLAMWFVSADSDLSKSQKDELIEYIECRTDACIDYFDN